MKPATAGTKPSDIKIVLTLLFHKHITTISTL